MVNEKINSTKGLVYPLYKGIVPKTVEEWLKRKRIQDNTEGLWRIHDNLYDLADFIKLHPGGPQRISSSKGTDITEAFETHHLKGIAEGLLTNYSVRKATTPRNQSFTFKEDGFYKTLKTKIVSKLSEIPRDARMKSDRVIDSLLIAFVVISPLSCWAWKFSVFLGVFLMLLNSWILNCLVTSAHNYFHRADNWRMYLFNLNGQSFEPWRISHSMSHHLFTNTVQDAEISLVEPFIQLLPYKDKSLWAQMAVFYWPAAGFMLFIRPVWQQLTNRTVKEKGFQWNQTIQFLWPTWIILTGGLSLLPTLLLWLTTSFLSSFFFSLFGLTAGHQTPENFFEGDIAREKSVDWAIHQLNTTMERIDYAGKHFKSLTRFGDHVLHHLFPTLDQAELKYLYPVLIAHCKEFGVEIRTTTFWEALVNLFKQIMRKGPKDYDEK